MGILALLVVIQFVPLDTSAPAENGEIPAPPEVREILTRACYDCHSSRTKWPWYSKVAPVSWWIADHVKDGRRHLNFTQWNSYDAKKRAEAFEESWEEVEHGAMPLPSYVRGHSEAKLSAEDKQALKAWSESFVPEPETTQK